MTRREVLALMGAAAAQAKSGYAPKLAAQAYVWTQVFDKAKRPLADGIDEMMRGFRDAGFRNVELMSNLFTPELREKTVAAAKAHGLSVPIVYVGGTFHEAAGAEKAIAGALQVGDAVKPLGTQYLNTNPNPKPAGAAKTDEELATQAKYVERLAAELKPRGLGLLLHHHDPEMKDNAREWRHLLRNTSLPLCIDFDWIHQGGQDGLGILKEAGSRVRSMHIRNARSKVWTESIDDGEYDYNAVAKHLRGIGYNGWLVVELALAEKTPQTRSLVENLKRSREFAERTFGVKA